MLMMSDVVNRLPAAMFAFTVELFVVVPDAPLVELLAILSVRPVVESDSLPAVVLLETLPGAPVGLLVELVTPKVALGDDVESAALDVEAPVVMVIVLAKVSVNVFDMLVVLLVVSVIEIV
jgi:hypothetical protein